MTPRADDDALSWDGDDDPTLQVDAHRVPVADADPAADAETEPEQEQLDAPVALPDGFTAVGKDADTVGRITPDGTVVMPGEREPMGNAALIGIGVLGGVYLLFTIGWIIGGLRLQGTAQFLVSPVIYQFALWLAVLAGPIWFGATYLLTRSSKTWVRVVWLLAGVVLLVPWPFIMTGAVGQ